MMNQQNRRAFVKNSILGSTMAFGLTSEAAAEKKNMIPIVDTHQHLWDLKQFKLPWVEAGSPLARNYVLKDYSEATEGLNVVKSVYMEVDVSPEQQLAEAQFVTDICKSGKTSMVAAVVSGRPAADDFGKYIDNFKGNKFIKGIRQVLHVPATPPGFCNQPEFVRGVRLLGERNLSYDLCVRGTDLGHTAKLIDSCPDTRFILDHCGNPDLKSKDNSAWKKGVAEIALKKNVVVKISGFIASSTKGGWKVDDLAPFINHTMDSFGPDRVMFGGDWPVCTLAATYKEWVESLKQVVKSRPEEQQKKLFHDNAVRFYGI
ncbi:MAG: amidohydrolase family protein [Gemmataceae bacterium]|jgi:L-fuconolactonase